MHINEINEWAVWRIQSHFKASPMPFKMPMHVKLRFNTRIRLFESILIRISSNVDQKLLLESLHYSCTWTSGSLWNYRAARTQRFSEDRRYIIEVSSHISVYIRESILWASGDRVSTGCAWAVCWSSYHGNLLFTLVLREHWSAVLKYLKCRSCTVDHLVPVNLWALKLLLDMYCIQVLHSAWIISNLIAYLFYFLTHSFNLLVISSLSFRCIYLLLSLKFRGHQKGCFNLLRWYLRFLQ